MNKKSDLCCHSDQNYETFHLYCYMLVCLIKFTMLSNVSNGSKTLPQIKKSIYVATVVKLIKHFIRSIRS